MRFAIALFALLIPLASLTADPLADARAAHAKEMARLKADLLAAIDQRLRDNQKAGRGNDYLLPERKAFAESGVTPLSPDLQAAVRVYLNGQRKADETLSESLDRNNVKPPAPVARGVGDDRLRLYDAVIGTTWTWPRGGEISFKPNGKVTHTLWKGFEARWATVDRRTVVLVITDAAPGPGKVAVLTFSDKIDQFSGIDFDAGVLTGGSRR